MTKPTVTYDVTKPTISYDITKPTFGYAGILLAPTHNDCDDARKSKDGEDTADSNLKNLVDLYGGQGSFKDINELLIVEINESLGYVVVCQMENGLLMLMSTHCAGSRNSSLFTNCVWMNKNSSPKSMTKVYLSFILTVR